TLLLRIYLEYMIPIHYAVGIVLLRAVCLYSFLITLFAIYYLQISFCFVQDAVTWPFSFLASIMLRSNFVSSRLDKRRRFDWHSCHTQKPSYPMIWHVFCFLWGFRTGAS